MKRQRNRRGLLVTLFLAAVLGTSAYAFTATNTSMIYPQYWDVDNWGQLFFRLQVAP